MQVPAIILTDTGNNLRPLSASSRASSAFFSCPSEEDSSPPTPQEQRGQEGQQEKDQDWKSRWFSNPLTKLMSGPLFQANDLEHQDTLTELPPAEDEYSKLATIVNHPFITEVQSFEETISQLKNHCQDLSRDYSQVQDLLERVQVDFGSYKYYNEQLWTQVEHQFNDLNQEKLDLEALKNQLERHYSNERQQCKHNESEMNRLATENNDLLIVVDEKLAQLEQQTLALENEQLAHQALKKKHDDFGENVRKFRDKVKVKMEDSEAKTRALLDQVKELEHKNEEQEVLMAQFQQEVKAMQLEKQNSFQDHQLLVEKVKSS